MNQSFSELPSPVQCAALGIILTSILQTFVLALRFVLHLGATYFELRIIQTILCAGTVSRQQREWGFCNKTNRAGDLPW